MIYDLIVGRKISGVETHYNCEYMQRKEVQLSNPAVEFSLLKAFLLDFLDETGGVPDQVTLAMKNIIELDESEPLSTVAEFIEALNMFDYGVFIILRTDLIVVDDPGGVDLTYLLDPSANKCARITSGVGHQYSDDTQDMHPNLPTAVMDFFTHNKITFTDKVNTIIDMDFQIKQYNLMRERGETSLFDMSSLYTMIRNLGYSIIIVLNAQLNN